MPRPRVRDRGSVRNRGRARVTFKRTMLTKRRARVRVRMIAAAFGAASTAAIVFITKPAKSAISMPSRKPLRSLSSSMNLILALEST